MHSLRDEKLNRTVIERARTAVEDIDGIESATPKWNIIFLEVARGI